MRVKPNERTQSVLHNLIFGDQGWAGRRLLLVLAGFILILLIGGIFFEWPSTNAVAARWQAGSLLLSLMPRLFLRLVAFFLSGNVLRYALPPLAALVAVLALGASYLQDIYALPTFWMALSYLLSSLFGLDAPRLLVNKGVIEKDPESVSSLEVIGGPGILTVNPGNAVIFESSLGDLRIRPNGRQLLQRFETIREIVNLQDHQDRIDEIHTISQEGIEVLVRDVQYRFRICFHVHGESPQSAGQSVTRRTEENPYPFSIRAVENMATNRLVTRDGLQSWEDEVKRAIRGAIVRYINQNRVDYLTAPRMKNLDPRGALQEQLYSSQMRAQLERYGAELLWINIGYFDLPDQSVDKERLEAWRTRWAGDTNSAARLHGRGPHPVPGDRARRRPGGDAGQHHQGGQRADHQLQSQTELAQPDHHAHRRDSQIDGGAHPPGRAGRRAGAFARDEEAMTSEKPAQPGGRGVSAWVAVGQWVSDGRGVKVG